ncbi:MAG TPA: DUF1573 domain-containing protein, partial [Phaeodactylibacter sp.]|nr:DUF1573 domain-containing protein [Phaeodactylibacter sp.]
MVAGIFFACGEDKAVKEEARASLTTTAPDNKVKPSDAGTPKAADVAAAPAGPTTTITFEESEFDFGTIKAGEKATHIYKFKNTGNEPLIISNAKG